MFYDIVTNEVLIIPMCAWVISQTIKIIVVSIKKRQIDLSYIMISGGMPSSHSAMVTALATSVAFVQGLASATFGIAAILAMIVMYDAAGVRQSVGQQSAVLNRIIRELRLRRSITELEHDLKEFIGHTQFQVIVGGLLGISVAWLWLAVVSA